MYKVLAAAAACCLATHASANSVECVAKQNALQFASALNDKSVEAVYNAIGFPEGCPKPTTFKTKPARPVATARPQGVSLFVNPTTGRDENDGLTEGSPLLTLRAARDAVRRLTKHEKRNGVTVNVQKGTHVLTETLHLTTEDSGEPGSPIRWVGEEGAVLSGGRDITRECDWQWTDSAQTTLQCSVTFDRPPMELFVDRVRRVRARFPNGDPLIPSDGYMNKDGCTTTKQNSTAIEYPLDTFVVTQAGVPVTNITTTGGKTNSTVVVTDMVKAREINNCKQKQSLFHNTRFDETYSTPFWDTTSIASMTITNTTLAAKMKAWVNPSNVVIKMYHPASWGGWAFESSSIVGTTINFARGGDQEARGGSGAGNFYIENVKEELDAANEWFYDNQTKVLYYIPTSAEEASQLMNKEIHTSAPQQKYIYRIVGESYDRPVHDIHVEGLNVTEADPTYLDRYEVPSGGDWSLHRGAAMFVQDAVGVHIKNVGFDQVGGNAVFFSNFVKDSEVFNCSFWRTGDSAILSVGSSVMARGSITTTPQNVSFSHNWIDTLGVYMKQTSCYFKSMSYKTTFANNLCYNGPRAGINFNDGFMGGDVVSGNLVFNMVTETGDHGSFNSWERRDWIFDCVDGSAGTCMRAETMHINNNVWVGPCGWNVDHDDGSSYYWDFKNNVYTGGFKYRDGDQRNMSSNLILEGAPAFQVTGFNEDYFLDNTLVNAVSDICAPSNIAGLNGTTYYTFNNASQPASVLPQDAQVCDNSTSMPLSAAQLTTMMRALWPEL